MCFFSCSSTKRQVEDVAWGYLNAMGNYKIDEATPYASELTQERTLPFAKKLVQSVDTNYIISDTPATITITKIDIKSDSTAIVTYHKVTPIKDMTGTLNLIKENGHWKAHAIAMQNNKPTDTIQNKSFPSTLKQELKEQFEKANSNN